MTVSSSIGPISGIDYGKLIDGLMGIEQRPLNQTNSLLKRVRSQSDSLLSISAQMTGLKLAATNFSSSAIFRSTTATSSNTNIMSATSNLSAPVGSYAFTVQRLAAASQLATQGFASATTAIGTSGVIPLTSQDYALNKPLKLATLNGGAGVASGSIKISTADSGSTVVDLSAAVTMQDVVDRINGAGASVTAAIKGDRLVLTDGTTGGNTLNVTNVSGGTTATDLGLTLPVAVGNTLIGADINRLAQTTSLSNLNGGNGVRTAGSSANDFTVTTTIKGTTSSFTVSLNGANTLGDVLNKINTAATTNGVQSVYATLDPNGHSIQLATANKGTTTNPDGGTIAVTVAGSSLAARDLGLTSVSSSGGVMTGQRINAGLNSALLRELNNGSGVKLGTINLKNGNGVSTDVDLTGASTVQDLLDKINAQSGTTSITAAINSAGNAVQLVTTSGGTDWFGVSDVSGSTASDLGISILLHGTTITGKDTQLRALGSGAVTVQLGRGALGEVERLADLNGGKGVGRGSIRIADRAGAVSMVDLSKAVDLQDVVDAINNAGTVNVVATIGGSHGDQLVLNDRSGGTGNLVINNVGTASTATDLGLTTGSLSVDKNTLTSSDLNKLNLNSSLNLLNNGNGVRVGGAGIADLRLAYTGGTVDVTLAGARTLGDVLAKINAAGNVGGVQKITAALSADGHGISLTAADAGTGGTMGVSNPNLTNAARDLGLAGAVAAGVVTGMRLNNAGNSPLLSELNGGKGVTLGTLAITNHGGQVSNVDLTGAQTLNDVINAINNNATGVTAALNSAGNGLLLSDTTGVSTGSLSSAGTPAAGLGLAVTTSGTSANSGDLHLRVLSDNTPLSALNGGTSFKGGKIKLTDSKNNSVTVDLSDAALSTMGEVLTKINTSALGTNIRASINPNGNGILLTDKESGPMTAKVEEVDGGTTAASLNLAGSFTGNTKDGTFQRTLSILGTDSLTTIAQKISASNLGVVASVINDGSGTSPFRLSLSARNSGAAGRILFDGSALGLNTTSLVQGQDAMVSYGGAGTGGLQATSSTNTFTALVPGLTLSLNGVGTASVTVARDDSKISDAVQTFTDSYNKVISSLAEVTRFDVNNSANNGALFGNSIAQEMQQALGSFIAKTFSGVGSLKTLAAAGISINQDASITLDTAKLQTSLATSPDDLRMLFTAKAGDTSHPYEGGIGVFLGSVIDRFTDAQNGTIFHTTDSLATQTTQLKSRAQDLSDLLMAKRNRLIRTYANLEVTIAQLQQQSKAVSSYTPVSATKTSG